MAYIECIEQGSAGDDRLQIDFLKLFIYQSGIQFDASGGQDEVQLSTQILDELVLASAGDTSASFIVQFGGNNLASTSLESFKQQGSVDTVVLL